ncbi:MAG TPA: hypothetical protein VGG16_28495 [Streptosporangiaceae bacterium]|jgi:hypothetical protein
MKRTRLIPAIFGVIVVPVLGLSLTGASSSAATPAPQPHKQTAVVNCLGKQQVKPGEVVLACADYNSLIDKITWTSWTSGLASGTGILVQNDCTPNCAEGHFHKYPVDLILWANHSYGSGQRFTEITEILPGARPPVFNGHKFVPAQRVETSQLWAPKI